jgi:uncharacterized membrane protein
MKSRFFNYAGWIVVWLLAFYFIWTNALRYFNPNFAVYTPKFKPFAASMVLHVAGGMTALVLGPLQFFTSLRTNRPRLHRAVGKVYLSAVLLSGLAAVHLAIFDNLLRKGEFIFATGTLGMAMAWFVTGGMAFFAIKNRNISQHKEWMIRSYVVTANFIIFRLIYYGLISLASFPYKEDVGGFTAWVGWSVPLLITEWVMQAKKIRRVPAKKVSSSKLLKRPMTSA